MPRASRSATALPLAKPVSASTAPGRPTVPAIASTVAAKLGASAVVATTPVDRINCEPSAQTTAWALWACRYSCASERRISALSGSVRLLWRPGGGSSSGGLRRPAAPPSPLGVVGRLLGLVGRAGRLRLGARLRLQPGAGGVQLGLQRLAPGDLLRQRLRVRRALGVRRLGLCRQGRDVGRELGAQLARPVVEQRADLRG